ncbi:MAG: type II toxin-antitoxin system HicA family toxin [Candidatus Atribacteria bacterium]|nr:type II toxin-antitoxin system HicA family toxin [Candidatus Atribacteria bacterium]
MKIKKLLQKAISNPENIRFTEVICLAEAFGFKLSRVKGSHHIFIHYQIKELLNFQNVSGMAKPYQVKQLLKIVEKYNLRLGENE